MKTSTARPGGADRDSRLGKRHELKRKKAELNQPQVSALTSNTEKTIASGLSVCVQRHHSHHTPTTSDNNARPRTNRSCANVSSGSSRMPRKRAVDCTISTSRDAGTATSDG